MVKPAVIFGDRNLLDQSALEKIGFEFDAVGSVSAAKVLGGQRFREYLRSPSGR